jgi:hypothetical protein
MFRTCLLGLVGGVLLTSACRSTSTAPAIEPASTSEVWSNTLTVGASRFYSFNVPLSGNVSVRLTELKQGGVATDEQVTLGLGTPTATDCALAGQFVAGASETAILTGPQPRGIYCIRIWDDSQLSTTTTFSVNITHPKQ